ncbi:MAG: hypothetical protein R2806_05920 [Saprospiraceae bacterium]
MNFSLPFFNFLITASLLLLTAGVILLLIMLFRDLKTKKLW